MRAVWSFWSKPFHARQSEPWCSPLHHLLAWGLSVRAAGQHYPDTVLITDRLGKKLLIDQLGLPFVHVSTELERIRDADTRWWMSGKLIAYGVQDRPFVHIDTDVFLWKRLPPRLEQAAAFSQSPERFGRVDRAYDPEDVERAFAQAGVNLPIEWEWARSKDTLYTAENCGILGGANVAFLRYYAQMAADLVINPKYAAAWSLGYDRRRHTILIEQFLASACAQYHRFHPGSPYRGVHFQRLFPTHPLYDPASSARMGYTHLICGAKSNPEVARRIEERVRREDPAYFRRCVQVSQGPHLSAIGA